MYHRFSLEGSYSKGDSFHPVYRLIFVVYESKEDNLGILHCRNFCSTPNSYIRHGHDRLKEADGTKTMFYRQRTVDKC